VVLALHAWEERGRPGARQTFASTIDYFAGKNPAGHFQILDFGTSLLGRDEQMQFLNEFAADTAKRVCILSGRGGIGKSKILHDWATANPAEVVFLKDEPQWHQDSEKEIPIDCRTIIVDDAHRQESLGKVLQILQDTARHRNLKLIVSTRPGSATRLAQQIFLKIDPSQVTQLPELQELNREQSLALASEVLGDTFKDFAAHLAEIGSNSPLVIVAGGRLIAARRINPSSLTTLQEFRSTIFNRLLQEIDVQGQFTIDPPRQVLNLIAALGPVDVETREFRQSAEALLRRPADEILTTIDELAATGIITPRPKPVRIIPDVLSDYVLEDKCINVSGHTTHYADRVYEQFGAHSFKELMRNLAELDWRRGQVSETGLNLLDGIWADIHERFRAGDEYVRHSILTDLAGAAIYQPNHVIGLVRAAIDHPVQVEPSGEFSRYRSGQEHVLSALPSLLEATAYHAEYLTESVTTLWELAKNRNERANSESSARSVLKRLASWHRFGHPALNFAMLVQAIRLTRREDAFTDEFTPFALIKQILERDGEYSEWTDDNTFSLSGFGLNYTAVGPVRESALDYLESALSGDEPAALCSIPIMENLLHHFLPRMGRPRTADEDEWQNRERERCLRALAQRYAQPSSLVLKARIYDALRSATAINCPEAISQSATAILAMIEVEDGVAVLDALCTADHDLPMLSTEFNEETWDRPITELMTRGRSSLERLIAGAGNQARFTIDQTCACLELRVKTNGFHRFMLAFTDRPDYLNEMAEQLMQHPQAGELTSHLSSVLNSIHIADPADFRQRALSALESGATHVIRAAANNLRVFEGATEHDVAVIQAYGGYPDPVAKRGAIFAITYMGKLIELRNELKHAVMSIHTEGDESVAADLAGAFGPYGIPLTMLTREEAAGVASEFLNVRDWEYDQGSIPRFLSRLAGLFPDEAYELLSRRIALRVEARAAHQSSFRSFGLVHANISFDGVPVEKRLDLARDCLGRLFVADSAEDLAQLYWDVAGYGDQALEVIVTSTQGADNVAVRNLATLIHKATPRLAFTNPRFAKDLLQQFTGANRENLVEAFAHQARHFSGGVYAGDFEEHMAQQNRRFADQTTAFPDDPTLSDLARALRRLT
jgi:hypothetical protein